MVPKYIIVGGTGLIGSAVAENLRRRGNLVLSINKANYAAEVGASADVLVNCNGNAYRYKANQDPLWDFDASAASVQRTLFDFQSKLYIYISTIDVYDIPYDPLRNSEEAPIDVSRLDTYGFHKWIAERLVEKNAPRSVIFRTGTVIGPGLRKGPLFDLINGHPIHLSPKSSLSLIDTSTIAEAVAAVIGPGPPRSIINLTGTGATTVADLAGIVGKPIRLAHGGDLKTYHYDINNRKLKTIVPVGSSSEIAARFVATDSGLKTG
jgi:nucleoside-diphosphate-sugar epimerase